MPFRSYSLAILNKHIYCYLRSPLLIFQRFVEILERNREKLWEIISWVNWLKLWRKMVLTFGLFIINIEKKKIHPILSELKNFVQEKHWPINTHRLICVFQSDFGYGFGCPPYPPNVVVFRYFKLIR